jgi:Domain of Unknown Function (DUF1080)
MKNNFLLFLLSCLCTNTFAQQQGDPKATEVWLPKPKVVTPGKTSADAPSDAIILFNGNNLNEWVNNKDTTKPAGWIITKNEFTVKKGTGDIRTKKVFTNYQLHIEWRIPKNITGSGQARGNSGIFLANLPEGGYEIQVLDSYQNETYVNGQAGSIYKDKIPLANAMRKPGEWQVYDIVWTAPLFNEDGSVKSPAYVTALHNGVLIQNNIAVKGFTFYIGEHYYKKHGAAPILLQDHGDPSEPISFRNIWLREL